MDDSLLYNILKELVESSQHSHLENLPYVMSGLYLSQNRTIHDRIERLIRDVAVNYNRMCMYQCSQDSQDESLTKPLADFFKNHSRINGVASFLKQKKISDLDSFLCDNKFKSHQCNNNGQDGDWNAFNADYKKLMGLINNLKDEIQKIQLENQKESIGTAESIEEHEQTVEKQEKSIEDILNLLMNKVNEEEKQGKFLCSEEDFMKQYTVCQSHLIKMDERASQLIVTCLDKIVELQKYKTYNEREKDNKKDNKKDS